MQLLHTFAALTLAAGAVMSLLPEGSIRRSAGMVVGLMMLMCWAEGIAALLDLSFGAASPSTVLTGSGADVTALSADACLALEQGLEVTP